VVLKLDDLCSQKLHEKFQIVYFHQIKECLEKIYFILKHLFEDYVASILFIFGSTNE